MDDAMGATPTLKITDTPLQGGRIQLTVRDGDEILHIDQLRVGKSTEREAFIAKLIEKHEGLTSIRDGIEAKLLRIAEKHSKARKAENNNEQPQDSPEAKAAAMEMLRSPNLIEHILDDVAALGVAGEEVLVAQLFMVGTSRLLSRPLAGIIQSPTSSGKSFTIDVVAKLFPPEAVIRAHSMTPQALAHMPEGSLKHRFVVAGERSLRQDDEAADATRALREILSDGRLDKLMANQTKDGYETIEIHQEGPIAYVESTTATNIRDEDANRCLLLSTDETSQQTKRVLKSTAMRLMGSALPHDSGVIIEKHRAAQRLLCRCTVVIPFADRLAAVFPSQRTDARRAFNHLSSMIQTCALLHQYQRIDGPEDGAIIAATRQDYELAERLVSGPLARTMGDQLPDATRRFGQRIHDRFGADDVFDSAVVQQGEEIVHDIQTIRRHMKALSDAGWLQVVERVRGPKPTTFRLGVCGGDASLTKWLPTPEAVFGDADGIPPESRRVKAQSDEVSGVGTRQEDQRVSGAATPQAG